MLTCIGNICHNISTNLKEKLLKKSDWIKVTKTITYNELYEAVESEIENYATGQHAA